ncbi:ferritin-like domain-containing protein [Ruegeria marina]|uniref:Ferritin-like metal-binding protein YciE n=1 Tax=Ruegeria marina TaxID=639004 RepID=A0A1G6IAW7_9RHOB|nr:DUF892 family protein [Ruegeria marina]SDC03588.1 Ferritin-like metal-binding protein YciE [Ruegeria marina]
MKVNDFQDLYIAELSELRSVEAQMADHLGALATQATNTSLADAITAHRNATENHRDRIDTLLQGHGATAGDSHDDASMHAILAETDKWAEMIDDSNLRDAGLIASLQRMEHYEIAVLGTLASWASKLGYDHDATVLSGILEDDKVCDARLTQIAQNGIDTKLH